MFLLFDLRQLAADLLVGRALLVVYLDKFPAHHALGVDDVGCRVRPTFAVGIKNSVAVDHFMIFVFEQREIELAVETFAQHLGEFLRLVMVVDADREDLGFFFLRFGQKAFQLPELFKAEGSPVAAVEN